MKTTSNKREEQLKNEIGEKYFRDFIHSDIIGSIDFAVSVPVANDEMFKDKHYLLWAEAKAGTKANIYDSFIQLIMTIGKERTYDQYGGPQFLGAFDEEKIAFIPYENVQDVFFQNDFDWTVPPSDHTSKEFLQLKQLVHEQLKESSDEVYLFHFADADKGLEKFIKNNFKDGKKTITLREVTKSNFTYVFQKWCEVVKPSLAVNWDNMRQYGFIEAYFFLADLLSLNNKSMKEKLRVILNSTQYILDTSVKHGWEDINRVDFNDNMRAHKLFWAHFKRPPRKEFHDLFLERIDLLVPPDIRERKGSYFTPPIWVKKSQEYLQDVLGENWQDEYYIWDCCAGTGNMEAGLKNKYRVWASTLDKADVNIMHQRIEEKKLPLLHEHCFQFDFLNDDLQSNKVPEDLRLILVDGEKRKKLLIYINPPYTEASSAKTVKGTGKNKNDVAKSAVYSRCKGVIGTSAREKYVQFLYRTKMEIEGCKLGVFCTLKLLQSSNFSKMRTVFCGELKSIFLMLSKTFDNVKGNFPIGFQIWDLSSKWTFKGILADVYDRKGNKFGHKFIYAYNSKKLVINWLRHFYDKQSPSIAYLSMRGTDFQNNKYININNHLSKNDIVKHLYTPITDKNIFYNCIYLAIRNCVEETWLNNRDQYLIPNISVENDKDFKSDSLVFVLFHGQNKISSKYGTNHWIPFTEEEVGARGLFDSHFMSDFINGKNQSTEQKDLFGNSLISGEPIKFTPAAQAVMDAGRELWRYYHSILGADRNASFYDIRAHFQGVDPTTGKMNSDSKDDKYNALIADLRAKMKILAKQIEVGVYKYGFLYNGDGGEQSEELATTEQPPFQNEPPVIDKGGEKVKKHSKTLKQTIINHYHISGDMNVKNMINE